MILLDLNIEGRGLAGVKRDGKPVCRTGFPSIRWYRFVQNWYSY